MKHILYILPFILLASCNDEPPFSVEPFIKNAVVQPKVAKQFVDPIIISFRFQDGDGDVGDGDDVLNNLYLKDNRSWLTPEQAIIAYDLPNLTPDTKNPAIQGTITIEVPPTAVRPGLDEETTTFDIYIVDRSDNESNTLTTEPIKIVK